MNTPPRTRSSRADRVPPAPLHGARFDSPPPTSRKGKGKGNGKGKGKGKDKASSSSFASSSSSSSYSTATISPPPSSPLGPDESAPSFEQTRKSRKRRASVFDEPVDKPVETESEGWKELEKMFGKDFGRGSTTVPSGVGLPTPSKTPARKKKNLSIDSVAGSARRLFGSTNLTPTAPTAKDILGAMPSGSKKRLGRLDLTGEDENDGGSISIFTDNNVRVPKYDPSPENPFITRKDNAKKKRQDKKVAKAVDVDKLGDDGRREDGMVYVFRGKKMFRKFADMDEPDEPLPTVHPESPILGNAGEEETGAEEEVGSEAKLQSELEKNLEKIEEESDEEDEEINTILNKRSSVLPRLLFPPKALEIEESEAEEEAETDVEDDFAAIAADIIKKKEKEIDRNAISRLTPDSDDDFSSGIKKGRVRFEDDIFGNKGDIPKSTRKKSSLFDNKELRKPIKGLFTDPKEEGSARVKRSRQDAFEGNLSPPRSGKKAKDLLG